VVSNSDCGWEELCILLSVIMQVEGAFAGSQVHRLLGVRQTQCFNSAHLSSGGGRTRCRDSRHPTRPARASCIASTDLSGESGERLDPACAMLRTLLVTGAGRRTQKRAMHPFPF